MDDLKNILIETTEITLVIILIFVAVSAPAVLFGIGIVYVTKGAYLLGAFTLIVSLFIMVLVSVAKRYYDERR